MNHVIQSTVHNTIHERTTISKGSGVTRRITVRFGSTITSVPAENVRGDDDIGNSSIAVFRSRVSLSQRPPSISRWQSGIYLCME